MLRRRPTAGSGSALLGTVNNNNNNNHTVPPIMRRASLLVAPPHNNGGASGVTSQQGTARLDADAAAAAAAATAEWHVFNDAQRLQYVLSGSETATLTDAFHRGAGSYVTLGTLRNFLTPIGVAVPSNDALLEEKVRRALQLELAFRRGAPSPLTRQPSMLAPVDSAQMMQRAAMKVLSARRLSARRASQASTPKLLHGGGGASPSPAAAARPVVIPATLSLDIVTWLMRVLKDDMLVLAASSAAADNPDTIEAFKSCASEATGVVTLKSVQEKCKLFDVVLDMNASNRRDRGDEMDDDNADDHGHHHRVFPKRLHTATTAGAALYSGSLDGGAAADCPSTVASTPTVVTTSPSNPQPPTNLMEKSFATDDGGGDADVLTPRGFADLLHITSDCQPPPPPPRVPQFHQTAAQGCGSPSYQQHRPATALSRTSPSAFVSIPYTDAELEMFQAAEEALRFSGGNNDAQHLTNALLGEAPRCPPLLDVTSASGSPLQRKNTLRRAQLGTIAAMNIKYSASDLAGGGNDPGSGAVGPYSGGIGLEGGVAGIDAASGVTLVLPSAASPSNASLLTASSRLLTQQYFLRQGGDHRPASAPPLDAKGGGDVSAAATSTRRAAHNDGAAFIEAFHKQQHEAHHSTLDIAPQAKGQPMVSLGVANHYVPGSSAQHTQQHPTDFQLSEMIEKQNLMRKTHPVRAALLGDYYHGIAKERGVSLGATAAAAGDGGNGSLYGSATFSAVDDERGASSVGQRLDHDFPLNGASWAALEHHLHHHRGKLAASSPHQQHHQSSSTSNVYARLTRLHHERPAIALYRLQQQLERLEASRTRPTTADPLSPALSGGAATSVERLRKFRALSASASRGTTVR